MYNPKQIYEAFLQPLSDTLDSDDQLKNLFLSYKMDLNNRATTWSKLVRSFAKKKKIGFFFPKNLLLLFRRRRQIYNYSPPFSWIGWNI